MAGLLLRAGKAFMIGMFLGWIVAGPAKASDNALIAPLAMKSLLLDGVSLSAGGRLVVVGERGHILYSDDKGDSWRQAEVPTRTTLTAVCFLDRTTGWAAGHDAIILMTRNAGENWEKVHEAPQEEKPILDLWSIGNGNGIAVGAYGYYLSTSDGGKTWTPLPFSDDPEQDAHLNQIVRSETGQYYIAAEGGRIYRSDDNTVSWRSLPSPYEGSFFGVLPIAGETLLIFGLRGRLYRSEDSGESWQAIESGTTAMLNAGLSLADGRQIIVGLGGTLLVSRDKGRHVSMVQQTDRKGISAVIPAGDSHLILIGEGGIRKMPISF